MKADAHSVKGLRKGFENEAQRAFAKTDTSAHKPTWNHSRIAGFENRQQKEKEYFEKKEKDIALRTLAASGVSPPYESSATAAGGIVAGAAGVATPTPAPHLPASERSRRNTATRLNQSDLVAASLSVRSNGSSMPPVSEVGYVSGSSSGIGLEYHSTISE